MTTVVQVVKGEGQGGHCTELDQGSGTSGSQGVFPTSLPRPMFFIFLRYGNFFIFTLIFSIFNFIFLVNLLL